MFEPKLKTIAIDDEPPALEIIAKYASKVSFIDLKATFVDACEAINYLQSNDVDLIFLDIKMPDISGIEFLSTLTSPPMVIFTTGYNEYAVQSYEHNAIDYLLKVFSMERFLKACNKAFEQWKLANPSQVATHIFIKDGYENIRLQIEDILYIEAKGNYVLFVTKNQGVMGRFTMKETLQLLPYNKFARIHKSYIVALDKVDKFDKYYATIGTKKIPIGNGYSL